MQKLFIAIAVLLSGQSFGQKTDVLELAQLEVKAIAHQLVLELKSNPPPELNPSQLNQLQESVEKIELARSLYAVIREPRARTALVYRVLLKAIGLDSLSETLPNRYLAARGFKSEIADVLDVYSPDWFASFEKIYLQKCDVQVHDPFVHGKYSYVLIGWRDGAQTFNIQLGTPVDETNFSFLRLLTLDYSRREFSDIYGKYEDASDLKVNIIALRDHTLNETREKAVVKMIRDPKNNGHYITKKEDQNSGDTYLDTISDGQISRSTYNSFDARGFLSQGVVARSQTTVCTKEKISESEVKFDSVIKSMIDIFRPIASATEIKRQVWLECLTKSTSDECRLPEASYKEAAEVRAATWEKLKSIPIPNRWLVQFVKDSGPKSKVEKNQEPTSVASSGRPEPSSGPFEIPDRHCRNMKKGTRYIAYCDGGMSCSFENQELAVCSNGMKCHLENGQVHCN